MRTQTTIGLILSAVIMAAGAPALAGSDAVPSLPSAGQFSLTPNGGTDFNVGGSFVKSGSQAVSNSTLLGANVTGTTVFSVNSKRFNDVYDLPWQFGVSGNYGLTNNDEVAASVHYLHASSKSFNALNVTSAGTFNGVAFAGNAAFQGQFNSYEEYGLDGDYRHFFNTPAQQFHPYIGGLLGLRHNNGINLDLSYNGAPVLTDIKFYKAGWTYDAGLEAGFRYDVAPAVALGLETGILYSGDLSQDSSAINAGSAGGLANVNSGGSRWDIPLLAGVTIKF